MITQELYAITYNSDLTEGRGYPITLGFAKSEALAKAIVSDPRFGRYCCMGFHNAQDCQKYNVSPKSVLIFESVEEPFDLEKQKIRDKALAKLTSEERELLGLS